MSIFAAALGASRGIKAISDDVKKEQERQKLVLQQLHLQDRQFGIETNNAQAYADGTAALGGTASEALMGGLRERGEAAKRMAGLQEEGLRTDITAKKHSMQDLDRKFLETVRQFDLNYKQQDKHHADQISTTRRGQDLNHADHQAGLRVQMRGQDLDAAGRAASLRASGADRNDVTLRLSRLAEAARDLTGAKGVMEDDNAYAARLSTNYRTLLTQAGIDPATVPTPELPAAPAAPSPQPSAAPAPGFRGVQLPALPQVFPGQRPAAPGAPAPGAPVTGGRPAPVAARPAAPAARPSAQPRKPAGPRAGKALYEEMF